MAEIQPVDDDAKARKRKPNFSVSEISAIQENVQKNINILQTKLTNAITNKTKNELWEDITKAVNAVGRANRSVQEVKDKWKNLHSVAKKEFATFKRETKKTGGGPAPKQPSQASEKIVEILEDTPRFSGLKGFETSLFTDLLFSQMIVERANEIKTAGD